MKLLSGILGLTLTSVVALASANAADIYRAPDVAVGYKDGPIYVPNWSGFYAGVNGGYGWSENSDQLRDFNVGGTFTGLAPQGGFGGGQVGYNWQGFWHPHIVLGFEADIEGSGITDRVTHTPGSGGVTGTYSSDLDWFGTVRGRVGYAFDTSLIYFTGGFAYGQVVNNVLYANGTHYRADDTATGYVLGGGWEYKFNPAWSFKVEYQFVDLGKNDPVRVSPADGVKYSSFRGIKVDEDAYSTVRVGLNYHFLPGYAPLK